MNTMTLIRYKPGPKLNHNSLVVHAIRLTREQKYLFNIAGPPDFWREVFDVIATHKIMFDAGAITPDIFAQDIGRSLLLICQAYKPQAVTG